MSDVNNARVLAAIEDVNDARSIEELEKVYEESSELYGIDEFDAAYFVAKAKLQDQAEVIETEALDLEEIDDGESEEVPMEDVDERAAEIKMLLEKMAELQAMIAAPRRVAKKTMKYKNRGYKLLKTTIDCETPQLLTVIDILKAIGADKVAMSEKDTLESMERNAGLFNITGLSQTATRIFKYYRPQLRDAGVIEIVRL